MANSPGWLVAQPIAHRGLHAKTEDVIENSSSAARAAIARGFAIECDIQRSSDGNAMVFHDEALERLTEAYMALGITAEAQNSAAVLGHNFPDSPWYKDAHALLQTGGLEPREEKTSFLSKIYRSVIGRTAAAE